MARYCNSPIQLTWFPGSPGDTSGSGVQLLTFGVTIADNLPLPLVLAQIIEEVRGVRAPASMFLPRQNTSGALSWVEIVTEANAAQTLVKGFTAGSVGPLPSVPGWVLVEIVTGDAFSLSGAAVEKWESIPKSTTESTRHVGRSIRFGQVAVVTVVPMPALSVLALSEDSSSQLPA